LTTTKGYRNVTCNATFQSAHAPDPESSAMSADYAEYEKGMQQAEPPLTDAALSELRKLIDDWLTKTTDEHMPFFLFTGSTKAPGVSVIFSGDPRILTAALEEYLGVLNGLMAERRKPN
jgi:hypothetical protein